VSAVALDHPPPPASVLTAIEAGRLERSMCGRKARLTRRGAMASARRARANGIGLSAYPCPFCGADEVCFWHVGHAPAMATVELLARYLRFGSEKLSHDSGEVGA
jgi:hypothetical protein